MNVVFYASKFKILLNRIISTQFRKSSTNRKSEKPNFFNQPIAAAPLPEIRDGWKLVYREIIQKGTLPRLASPMGSSVFAYFILTGVVSSYIYLKFFHPQRLALLKQLHPVWFFVFGCYLFLIVGVLFLRRRFHVAEIYRNVRNPRKYYLTRYKWNLRREKISFNISQVSTSYTAASDADNILMDAFGNFYGRWGFSVDNDGRSMRLFDQWFTDSEEKTKLLRVVWK